MTTEQQTRGEHQTLPTLIAWLSTCMLAAGLGKMVEPLRHGLWLQAGCFGLVAAVGLDATARMRWRRQRLKQWRTVQRRCERSLDGYVAARDVADELRAAVTQLLAAGRRPSRESSEGEEARWSCNLPVEIYAVPKGGPSAWPENDLSGVNGQLDNLSNSGFGMKLDEQLGSRLVIIAFAPPEEQEFDLLGEILWCDRFPDGRMRAGGRLLRVLPMGSQRPVAWRSMEEEDAPADAAC